MVDTTAGIPDTVPVPGRQPDTGLSHSLPRQEVVELLVVAEVVVNSVQKKKQKEKERERGEFRPKKKEKTKSTESPHRKGPGCSMTV